nr:unnamed protein product [Spirometra erinaceieuropaei]
MQASTRLSTINIHDLLFADDYTLNTETEADMQRSMELFASSFANFGLTINTDKTVVMHQSSPNAACIAPLIHVNGAQLKTVDNLAC